MIKCADITRLVWTVVAEEDARRRKVALEEQRKNALANKIPKEEVWKWWDANLTLKFSLKEPVILSKVHRVVFVMGTWPYGVSSIRVYGSLDIDLQLRKLIIQAFMESECTKFFVSVKRDVSKSPTTSQDLRATITFKSMFMPSGY